VAGKATEIGRRAIQLSRLARPRHPDLAVGFNSYAQAVAARICGIPLATLTDYEYQPANNLAFRLARRIIVPRGFDRQMLRRQGASPRRVVFYDGLKEDVTLTDFVADRAFPQQLVALGVPPDSLVVTMRPPATNSLYHRFENEWFYEVLANLARRPSVFVVVLPRYPPQAERVRSLGLGNVVVPGVVLDGLNLIYWSDLVVSAGGSMNREAVVLGTSAATVFSGRMAGVDRRLIADGRLLNLRARADLDRLVVAKKARSEHLVTSHSTVDHIVAALLEATGPGSGAVAPVARVAHVARVARRRRR
jgi:hypothetical protein